MCSLMYIKYASIKLLEKRTEQFNKMKSFYLVCVFFLVSYHWLQASKEQRYGLSCSGTCGIRCPNDCFWVTIIPKYSGIKWPYVTFIEFCALGIRVDLGWLLSVPWCLGSQQNFWELKASGVLFLNYFYWSLIALQGCISSCCIAKWISHTYTYIPSLLDFLPMQVITVL